MPASRIESLRGGLMSFVQLIKPEHSCVTLPPKRRVVLQTKALLLKGFRRTPCRTYDAETESVCLAWMLEKPRAGQVPRLGHREAIVEAGVRVSSSTGHIALGKAQLLHEVMSG